MAPLELKSAVVIGHGAILYFKTKNRLLDKAVIICADAVDSKLYRQLRVYCRYPKTFQK